MKKRILISGCIASLFLSCSVLAHDSCTVIGYHEPGTQTYDGPTFCDHVTIKNIIVRGPLHVAHSRMRGMTEVSGPIFAKNTVFDNITVENNFSHMLVVLKNTTLDKGNLDFQGESGFYRLDNTSNICGKVINGSIAK